MDPGQDPRLAAALLIAKGTIWDASSSSDDEDDSGPDHTIDVLADAKRLQEQFLDMYAGTTPATSHQGSQELIAGDVSGTDGDESNDSAGDETQVLVQEDAKGEAPTGRSSVLEGDEDKKPKDKNGKKTQGGKNGEPKKKTKKTPTKTKKTPAKNPSEDEVEAETPFHAKAKKKTIKKSTAGGKRQRRRRARPLLRMGRRHTHLWMQRRRRKPISVPGVKSGSFARATSPHT